MPRPKQHHYVTRAYLEGFLPPGEAHLYVYTRNKEMYFRSAPDKLARIGNYYSVRSDDGTFDDRLESILQKEVEDPGLTVIRRLNSGRYDISAYARRSLAMLMAIQENRVPWVRQNIENIFGAALNSVTATMLEVPSYLERRLAELRDSDTDLSDVSADEMRRSFNNKDIEIKATPSASLWMMGSLAETLVGAYFSMRWLVLETKTVPFITSDCPVHRYYSPVESAIPFTGLADPRAEVRFPLSAHRMLVLVNDNLKMKLFSELQQRGLHRQAERLRGRASPIHRAAITEEQANEINAHTASMAARWAFSSMALADLPTHLQGECQNMRSQVTELPGGLLKVSSIYPERKP